MKIAAHITFFYVPTRIGYLKTVIEKLNSIPQELRIYVYTNEALPAEITSLKGVEVLQFPYKKQKWVQLLSFFDFKALRPITYPLSRALNQYLYRFFHTLGLKRFLHPFYLTWENRVVVQKEVANFDAQMYLEDDMGFGAEAFQYWLTYNECCIRNGYNLGFLRTESDANGKLWITDLTDKPKQIIELEGQKFLLNDNNPYCAIWIYSVSELKKFMQSPEWRFNFRGVNVREKSAVGWHSQNMKHYKGTLIPLVENADGSYSVHPGAAIQHLPNNYIGDAVFCKLPFPFSV